MPSDRKDTVRPSDRSWPLAERRCALCAQVEDARRVNPVEGMVAECAAKMLLMIRLPQTKKKSSSIDFEGDQYLVFAAAYTSTARDPNQDGSFGHFVEPCQAQIAFVQYFCYSLCILTNFSCLAEPKKSPGFAKPKLLPSPSKVKPRFTPVGRVCACVVIQKIFFRYAKACQICVYHVCHGQELQ